MYICCYCFVTVIIMTLVHSVRYPQCTSKSKNSCILPSLNKSSSLIFLLTSLSRCQQHAFLNITLSDRYKLDAKQRTDNSHTHF